MDVFIEGRRYNHSHVKKVELCAVCSSLDRSSLSLSSLVVDFLVWLGPAGRWIWSSLTTVEVKVLDVLRLFQGVG